jgi:poly(A) polymerase
MERFEFKPLNNIMNVSDRLTPLEIFEAVKVAAARLGTPAYAIGGYVRDLLLNRKSKDIDFVCIGSGIELAHETAKVLGIKGEVTVFKNFGTAMFRFENLDIEFVGARKESYQRHSRKPIVEDGSLEDDQKRRDFTINALAISMDTANFGELIDPFDGRHAA